jgi:glutathione peroxidase
MESAMHRRPANLDRRRACGLALAWAAAPALAQSPPAACPAWLQLSQPRLQDEKPVSLCSYAGQVLLVVNTASFCGYTPQYKALEALQARYRDRGLAVLGFPSNDFGQQEPGSGADIAAFCENTFGVRFPMFAKSHVVAGRAGAVNPLFASLAQRSGQAPRWNFHKYLVSRHGDQVLSYPSAMSPDDPNVIRALERLLQTK